VSLFISIASKRDILTDLSPRPPACLCLSVHCGKTAEWIVCRTGYGEWGQSGMRVIEGGGDRQRERGRFGGEFRASSIVTNGDFVA